MDPKRFDALARWISSTVPRRAFGVIGAATLADLVITRTWLGGDGKRKHRNKKKCKPCRKLKHGKCKKRLPDRTPCGAGKSCLNGSCVPIVCEPTCVLPETCVSGTCYCPETHACAERCCPEPIDRDGSDCSCQGEACGCPETAVVFAAGDIAACDSTGHVRTAALLDDLVRDGDTVLLLGDTAYQSGSAVDFACYHQTWGRFKHQTRPALGDHEYQTPGAAGYFNYFGDAAGERNKGYYSFDLGSWHIVVLNTNCDEVGGCGAGSPQERWLVQDLAAHQDKCTLAVIHHPRFSSGVTHGSHKSMEPFWQALYSAGADIVLSGNEHNYERFAPQTPNGTRDDRRGIRQFVVGTGGIGHYRIGKVIAHSEARDDTSLGVLQLTLLQGAYRWRFHPIEDHDYTDSGFAVCHDV